MASKKQVKITDAFDAEDEDPIVSGEWSSVNVRLINNVATVSESGPGTGLLESLDHVPLDNGQMIRGMVASDREPNHVGIGGRLVIGDSRWGGYLLSLHWATGGSRVLLLEKFDSNHRGIKRPLASTQVTLVQKDNSDFSVLQELKLIITDTDRGVQLSCYVNNDDENAPNLSFLDLGQSISGPATYQVPGSGGVQVAQRIDGIPVSITNETGVLRSDMITVGVKFKPGEVRDSNQQFMVTGARDRSDRVQWKPFGDNYPDGSIQFAEMKFPATWTTQDTAEKLVNILPLEEPNPVPFTWTTNTINSLTRCTFHFNIQENGQDQTQHIIVTRDQQFSQIDGADPYAHVQRFRHFSRLPGRLRTFWIEIVIDVYSGLDHGEMWFWMGKSLNCLPSDTEWYSPYNRRPALDTDPLGDAYTELEQTPATPEGNWCWFDVYGPDVYMREEAYKVDNSSRESLAPGIRHSHFVLFRPEQAPGSNTHTFATGQSYGAKFSIVHQPDREEATHIAESRDDTYAMQMDLALRGGLPPFYNVPDYPEYIQRPLNAEPYDPVLTRLEAVARLQAYTALWENRMTANDPWQANGLLGQRQSDATGGSPNFAPLRMWIMLKAGYPRFLRVVQRETRQELSRANLFMGPNGDRFNSEVFHNAIDPVTNARATIFLWYSTLYNTGGVGNISNNMGIREDLNITGTPYNWSGPDRQHWMLTQQAIAAFLGRDYMQVAQMENMSQVWLASHPVDRGGGFIPLMKQDGSRGIGRGMFMVGATLAAFDAVASAQIKRLLEARVNILENLVTGHQDERYWGYTNPLPTDLIALIEAGAGSKASELKTVPFISWDMPVGIAGLWSVYLLLGEGNPYGAIAKRIAAECAGTVVQYYYRDFRTDYQRIRFQSIDEEYRGNAGFTNLMGDTVTGSESGATGICYFVSAPDSYIYLSDCVGLFSNLDVLNFSGGAVATQPESGGTDRGWTTITALASNNHVPMTMAQLEASLLYTRSGPYTVSNAPPTVSPTVLTVTPDPSASGIGVGDLVNVSGILGNTLANGDFVVTAVNATTISIDVDTSAGGAYTSGGTVNEYEWWLTNVIWSPNFYEVEHLIGVVIAEKMAKENFYGASSAAIETQCRVIYNDIKSRWAPDTRDPGTWHDFDENFAVIGDIPDSGGEQPPSNPSNFNLTTLSQTEILAEFDFDPTAVYSEVELQIDGIYTTKLRINHGTGEVVVVGGVVNALQPATAYTGRARSFKTGFLASGYSNTDTATTLEENGGGGGTQPIEFVPPHKAVGTWGFFLSGEGAFLDFFEALDQIVLRVRNVEAGRTLLALREAVTRLVDRTNKQNRDPETLNQFINDAVDDLLIELGDLSLFARVEEELDLEADGTGRIFLPRHVERVEKVKGASGRTDYQFQYRDGDAEGRLSIELLGMCYAHSGTFLVTYFRAPNVLEEDDDRTLVPQRIDEAVVVGAARRCAEQDGDPAFAQAMTIRFGELLQRARKHMSRTYRHSRSAMRSNGNYLSPLRMPP